MSEAARDYVPDPRDDPDWWTVGRVADEQRPKRREDGSGGPRTLWAVCVAPGCGSQKTLDAAFLSRAGFANKAVSDLPLTCRCGSHGHARLTWVNEPRIRDRGAAFPTPGRPRAGSFDFATGKKVGGWD